MSFRCINAFAYDGDVYPNGFIAVEGDPILRTHPDHFAEVEVGFTALAVEQAEAAPGGLRSVTKKKTPAKVAHKPGSKPGPKPADESSSADSDEEK